MIVGHIIGEHLFDVIHHGMIFGLGFCAGLIGITWMVSKKVK